MPRPRRRFQALPESLGCLVLRCTSTRSISGRTRLPTLATFHHFLACFLCHLSSLNHLTTTLSILFFFFTLCPCFSVTSRLAHVLQHLSTPGNSISSASSTKIRRWGLSRNHCPVDKRGEGVIRLSHLQDTNQSRASEVLHSRPFRKGVLLSFSFSLLLFGACHCIILGGAAGKQRDILHVYRSSIGRRPCRFYGK